MGTLQAVAFDPSMIEAVAGFNCGDESWQRDLASWIINESHAAMDRGTKVWLYVESAGEIVGYGSLGTTNWKYPDPDSRRTMVAIIPAVAIQRQFHGQSVNNLASRGSFFYFGDSFSSRFMNRNPSALNLQNQFGGNGSRAGGILMYSTKPYLSNSRPTEL